MKKKIDISVFNVVGSKFCISEDDGVKIFRTVLESLVDYNKINLSFENVEIISISFLQASIGRLYVVLKEDYIENHFKIKYLDRYDNYRLNIVIENAKKWVFNDA